MIEFGTLSGDEARRVRPLPSPGWHIRVATGVRRSFIGVEMERLGNGFLWRVSFWPMRCGFFVLIWNEPPYRDSNGR